MDGSLAPMVVLVPVGQPEHKAKRYTNMKNLPAIRTFSSFAIALGILSIALQIAALCTNEPYYSFDVIGHGIWAGSLYIVAGGLGLGAASEKTRGLIISTIVFGSLSMASSIPAAVLSGLSATVAHYCYNYYCVPWLTLEWILMAVSILALCNSITLTSLVSVALCNGRQTSYPPVIYQPSIHNGSYLGNIYQQPMTGYNYSNQSFTPVYMGGMQSAQPIQHPLALSTHQPAVVQQARTKAEDPACTMMKH